MACAATLRLTGLVVLGVALRAGAVRAVGEDLEAVLVAGDISGGEPQKATICKVEEGQIVACGMKSECKASPCPGYAEVDFAGANSDSACVSEALKWMPCPSLQARQQVPLPGQRDPGWCCLCPLGKKYDAKKGWCTTTDFSKRQIPCSALPGACKKTDGHLHLAGSTPEAACRTRNLFVSLCPATARSYMRELVSVPGVFKESEEAYCCICPENSVYSSSEKACVCKGSAVSMERLLPINHVCPESQDSAISGAVKGDTDAQRVAPAMRQISFVRATCLGHRFLDEVVDPHAYNHMMIRDSLNNARPKRIGGEATVAIESFAAANGIAIESITILKLDTVLRLNSEADGVVIEFVKDLKVEVGVGETHIFAEGVHTPLKGPEGGYAVEVGATIQGKELLSTIVEFGSAGQLMTTIDKLKINIPNVPELVASSLRTFIERTVLRQVLGEVFAGIGHAARQASVDGPLASLMEDFNIFPIELKTKVESGECPREQLCLGLEFRVGQKQEMKTMFGATFRSLHLGVGVTDGEDFSSKVTGHAGLDLQRTISEVFGQLTQDKLDVAFGDRVVEESGEKEDAAPKQLKVQPLKTMKTKLVKTEVCKARVDDWNMHRVVGSVGQVGGMFAGMAFNIFGAVYNAYNSGDVKNLKVPSAPGVERGNFEANLFEAWQASFPQHKGVFSRSQQEGQEPSFAVVSLESVQLGAHGKLDIKKEGTAIKISGSFEVSSLQVSGLRHDSCSPDAAFTSKEEFTKCWQPSAVVNGLTVGLNPTTVSVLAEVHESGDMTVCADVKSLSIMSGLGGVADTSVNLLTYTLGAKRFLEDLIEVQLGEALFQAIVVKQNGRLDGARVDVTLAPDKVDIDVSLGAKWQDIGRLQASVASQPPSLESTGEAPSGVGSAWQTLKEKAAEDSPEMRKKLGRAMESFSRDPREWLAAGKLGVSSELVHGLMLDGSADFTGADVPLQLDGRIQLKLGKLLWANANDAGVKDHGQYAAAAQMVVVGKPGSWKDMEAVVSCGSLFLSQPAPEHRFRLTSGGRSRFTLQVDLTKSAATSKRDGTKSFLEREGADGELECPGNKVGFHGVEVPSVGNVMDYLNGGRVNVCVERGSLLEAALTSEFTKRERIDKMILEEGASASVLWSPLTTYFKNGPFSWEDGGERHSDEVNANCKEEVARCELALECMGVQLHLGECNFLSVYDLDDGVKGHYLYKKYLVGPPESWGAQ